jgi:FixJ family two-component response regulator
LSKPFDDEQLIEHLQTALRPQRRTRTNKQ